IFVMYASGNESGWKTQKVSNGTAYSLIFDANDNPHILYSYYAPVYPSPRGLMYASWTGSSWNSQTVDPSDTGFGMVALDSHGNPHVAYTDGTTIKYAVSNGEDWSIQTVAQYEKGALAFRLSFVLDKNDTPYIMYSPSSYVDYSQDVGIQGVGIIGMNVTLATYQNSSWKFQPLSLPTPTGDYGNLVVDSKSSLHSIFTQHYVSSENTIRSTLLYASWNGTAWDTQPVVSNISLNSMSLALDSRDYPHIFTSSGEYAVWTGSEWSFKTRTYANNQVYLALDSNDNPHVSYLQGTTSQVIANIVYATAIITDVDIEPTQPPSPTFPDVPLLLVSTAVIIGVVVTVVYVWKKKTQKP
ncbi:hypothetical protein JXA31_00350, partial [Candidatus Bathyarchaeota archaeon]|nr:hypothetical protein [Candidatus Bathyarchaeota archaeon]